MTTEREKIISLAKENGCHLMLRSGFGDCQIPQFYSVDDLISFYHAAQREAFEEAAKLCDELAANGVFYKDYAEHAFAGDCAAAIREMAKEMK